MKTIVRLMLVVMLMLVPMLMIVAAPAYAGEATQMWRCELDDDITEEEVIANAQEWLKAAKTMKGGANLQAHIFFPVAVKKSYLTFWLGVSQCISNHLIFIIKQIQYLRLISFSKEFGFFHGLWDMVEKKSA